MDPSAGDEVPDLGTPRVDALAGSLRGVSEEDDIRKGCCTARCHRAADMEPPYPRHFQYHVSPLERCVFQYVFASTFAGGVGPAVAASLLRSGGSVFINGVSIYTNFIALGGRDSDKNYNLSAYIVAYVEFIMFHTLLFWGLYRIHSRVRRGRRERRQFSPEDLASAVDHMRTSVQRMAWNLVITLGTFQTFLLLDYFRPPKIRWLLMRVRTHSSGAVLPNFVKYIIVPGYLFIGCLCVMAVFVKLHQISIIFEGDPGAEQPHPLCLGDHPCWKLLWYIRFAGFFNNLLRLDRSENMMVDLLQHVAVGHYAPSCGVQSDKADSLVTSFYEQMFKGGPRRVAAFERFVFFAALNSAQLLRYLEMCEGAGSTTLRGREQLQFFLKYQDQHGAGSVFGKAGFRDSRLSLPPGGLKGLNVHEEIECRKRETLRSMDPMRANPIVGVDSTRMPRILRLIDSYAQGYLHKGFLRPVSLDPAHPSQSHCPPGVFVDTQTGEHLGGICLTVERAYELLEAEWSVGKLTGAEGCDPYVLVTAMPSKLRCRTSTRRNTLFPDFGESFQLPIPRRGNAVELQLAVYDEGSSLGGFMGFASLVVPEEQLYGGKLRYRLRLGPRRGNAADKKRFARCTQSGRVSGFGFVDVVLYARRTTDVQRESEEQLRKIFFMMPITDVESETQQLVSDSPNWVRDQDASHCKLCFTKFTFTLRRHHCRMCGGVFCNACSRHREYIKEFGQCKQRVCDECKEALGEPQQPVAQRKEIRLDTLRQTFERVDDDRSGSIDKEEIEIIRPMLKYMGVSDEDVEIILEEADEDQNGTLDFEEFVAIFRDRLGYAVKQSDGTNVPGKHSMRTNHTTRTLPQQPAAAWPAARSDAGPRAGPPLPLPPPPGGTPRTPQRAASSPPPGPPPAAAGAAAAPSPERPAPAAHRPEHACPAGGPLRPPRSPPMQPQQQQQRGRAAKRVTVSATRVSPGDAITDFDGTEYVAMPAGKTLSASGAAIVAAPVPAGRGPAALAAERDPLQSSARSAGSPPAIVMSPASSAVGELLHAPHGPRRGSGLGRTQPPRRGSRQASTLSDTPDAPAPPPPAARLPRDHDGYSDSGQGELSRTLHFL